MSINIAIDGPCGAGKSTIAKMLAEKLDYTYLDTGAMYRALGLKALRLKVDITDEKAVENLLETTTVDIAHDNSGQIVYLDEEDVSQAIRQHEVSKMASDISALPSVRIHMATMQREIASKQNCILDGREIGTYVLPDADIKFFLTAKPSVRAARRHAELLAKGEDITFEKVLQDVKQRDYNDANRDFAPMYQAKDAVKIDSTNKNIDQVLAKMMRVFKVKTRKTKHLNRFVRVIKQPFKLIYPTKIYNLERIEERKTIVVFNHSSGWDSVVLTIWCKKRLHFMYKSEFDKSKFLKSVFKHLEHVSVRRGTPDIVAIKKCMQLLAENKVLCLSPEGTRNKIPDTLQEFKTGSALLALKTHATILPVYIFDRFKPFHKNYILVGERFDLSEYYNQPITKAVLTETTDIIKQKVDQTRIALNEIVGKNGVKRRKRTKKELKEMEEFTRRREAKAKLQDELRKKFAENEADDENFEIARKLEEELQEESAE